MQLPWHRLLTVLALVALCAPALAADPAAVPTVTASDVRDLPGVMGRVTGAAGEAPLAAVRVYAYQVADLELHRSLTDERGAFRFSSLPVGLYKVIAHKSGFVPAVVMLTRNRADARQVVELQLAPQRAGATAAEDFWSIRDRIPADVLREILGPDSAVEMTAFESSTDQQIAPGRFATQMEAMTGVDHSAGGESTLTGGQLGVEGNMGAFRVGLSGDYWRMGSAATRGLDAEAAAAGEGHHVALAVEHGQAGRFSLLSRSHRLIGTAEVPVDFETYRADWTQDVGEGGRARIAADYTSQTNYYRQGGIDPLEIPGDSQAWGVEGALTQEATDRVSFQAGFRYRDRSVGVAAGEAHPVLDDERLDLFGRSGIRIQPTVLVEYGLYTTLRDGSLSLVPHGGLVLQISENWQASTLVSRKVSLDHEEGPRDFIPAFHGESSTCSQGEESCYQVLLSRRLSEDAAESLTVGAVHREIGETLRLFFNDDFFNYLESLYLVRGDRVPEVQIGLSRRVSPRVLAHLQSNVGQGGGGIFYATDQARYQNSVRYMVTSLDTRFQDTATGLFVSFHHLEQQLDPLQDFDRASTESPRLEQQRLQLMLTQDLNILLDLAADWAVKLNMEVSRGSELFGTSAAAAGDEDEVRRRILGGFAVRF